jgi:Flp pilus assembly protein TadG
MRDKQGQILIEAAIILPLLLLLIFGMADFARAMYYKNTLNNAARAGARTASVTPALAPEAGTLPPDPAKDTPLAGSIRNSIFNGIPVGSIKYDLSIFDISGTPITTTAVSSNVVRVTVTYDNFTMITPFYKIAAIITNSATPSSGTLTLSAQASMRYE